MTSVEPGDEAIAWYQQQIDELGRVHQAQVRETALARFEYARTALMEFFEGEDQMLSAATLVDAGSAPPRSIQYFGDYEDLVEVARGGMGVVYPRGSVHLVARLPSR